MSQKLLQNKENKLNKPDFMRKQHGELHGMTFTVRALGPYHSIIKVTCINMAINIYFKKVFWTPVSHSGSDSNAFT